MPKNGWFSWRRPRWGRSSFTLRTGASAPWSLPEKAPHGHRSKSALPPHLKPLIEAAKRELIAYFSGASTDFAALTLDPRGTPFQLRVWQELRRIPRGQTISYGELARRVGSPKASRAVGQANAVNPIPLIIPCHRVIAGGRHSGGL